MNSANRTLCKGKKNIRIEKESTAGKCFLRLTKEYVFEGGPPDGVELSVVGYALA